MFATLTSTCVPFFELHFFVFPCCFWPWNLQANNIQGSWIAISGRTHRTLTSAWRRSWQAAIKTADRGFKHAQVLQACLENAWERFTINDARNMRSTAPQQRLAKAVGH
jgi:ribosomal protein L32E